MNAGTADLLITSLLTIVGLYLTHSLRRQLTMRVGEKRLVAYAALWDKMSHVSPARVSAWMDQPLTLEERQELFRDFTKWYYENGNGMFLGENTRAVYLAVKDNLVCPARFFKPASIASTLESKSEQKQNDLRGRLSIRQLSLLRNRMKADLAVFGLLYHTDLNDTDIEFL
jgi:hypothetical protein